MTPDQYLRNILARERVDSGMHSPVRRAAVSLAPMLERWGNGFLLAIEPSGSFAKGTANRRSTDIDLFLTLSSSTPNSLAQIRSSLGNCLRQNGLQYRDQNVSLGVMLSGMQIDLVPGRRQSPHGNDHSLFRKKANTWTKTNIKKHISIVQKSGRTEEIRVLKLWRDQKGLDFPSIYLELATLEALRGKPMGQISRNVTAALKFFGTSIISKQIVDPANSNNIISGDVNNAGKQAIAQAAKRALTGKWNELIR